MTGQWQLLGDLAAGKAEALGELYDRHAASLFRHALALSRRRPDAEDLVQAVFVKLATTGAELVGVRRLRPTCIARCTRPGSISSVARPRASASQHAAPRHSPRNPT